jgi:ring-1,2-phenylacetyl-CoA epoxidase subunit PaaD
MVKQLDEMTGIEAAVRAALAGVHDPEIPPLSIVDLGIVERVEVGDGAVRVDLLPTFAGCPALDAIHQDVTKALAEVSQGLRLEVRFVHAPPWTSDRITPSGREALRTYGLTPPSGRAPAGGPVRVALGSRIDRPPAACPFCGSEDTVLESAFGPTLCRSTHFCHACRNPFEAFKPKGPAVTGR